MKLLKVLVAALVMAAMVTPVFAEDRLSLSGEMRVRAFHTDYDVKNLDTDNTQTWANQRLRLGGKIAVAEGVSVTFRTDITEGSNWGDSSSYAGTTGPIRSNGFGHARSGAQQQWDRAHLDISKGMFHLRAGQQYIGSGGTWAVDTQDSGLSLDIATSVPVKAFFIVDNDYGSKNAADAFLTGLFVDHKGDNHKVKFIVANSARSGAAASAYSKAFAAELLAENLSLDGKAENVYLFGLSGSTNLGAVKLFGEFDYFSGDSFDVVDNATGQSQSVDAFGTQLMLDASMAAGDAATVGAQFFYAMGDDEDVQYVHLGNGFNGWDPIFDVGTSLSNEEIVFGRPFDFTGMSAGVVGGRLYSDIKLNDAFNLGVSASYLTEEEDAAIESDGYQLAAGLKYAILENTSFQLQLQYEDMNRQDSITSVKNDYSAFRAGTGFFVKF